MLLTVASLTVVASDLEGAIYEAKLAARDAAGVEERRKKAVDWVGLLLGDEPPRDHLGECHYCSADFDNGDAHFAGCCDWIGAKTFFLKETGAAKS